MASSIIVREIKDGEKNLYNRAVSHVIQSWEWGEFRGRMGLDLVRLGHFEGNKLSLAYQLTFHPVPLLKQTIGYLPKGPLPDKQMIDALKTLGGQKNATFIKIKPNLISHQSPATRDQLSKLGLVASKKSLFTKYNFLIDLTKSEDQLLAAMHPKTRYNIGRSEERRVGKEC